MHRPRLRRITAMGVLAAVPAIVLTACSSSTKSSTAPSSTAAAAGSSSDTAAASSSGSSPAAAVPTLEQLFQGNEGTPPSSGPPAAKNKTVYWISCGQQSAACAGYAAAGQAAAQAIGWTFKLIDGNLNTANGYANGMRTALAAHPSAIVEDAFSCDVVQPELVQAKAEKVPVIGVDTTDCNDAGTGPALFTVPLVYSSTYPTNAAWWAGWGSWAADFIVADSGGKAKIIVNYGQGQSQYKFMNDAFNAVIKACTGCPIVDSVNWTLADLQPNGPWVTGLRNALIKHPEASYVWFPFDFNAVESGGAKAVLQSGSKAKVVTNTGEASALALIPSGQIYAEAAAKSSEWESWAAMDELNRYFAGQQSVPEGEGYISIDKDHNMPTQSNVDYQTKVDFESIYKKSWGVG